MPPRCTPIASSITPDAAYPLWYLPASVLSSSGWRATTINTVFGSPILGVRADPKRVAVGFTAGAAMANNILIGPGNRPDLTGFSFTQGSTQLWFHLFQYGPMVCSDWWVYSSSMTPLTIYEWYRLT